MTVALPHTTRNAVFTALFTFVKTIPLPQGIAQTSQSTWRTYSQLLKSWDEVPAVEQPAIFLHRGPQRAEQTKAFGVTKWKWTATLWIYFRTDGLKTQNTYPDQVTDALLDSIEQLFQTDPLDGRLTLGKNSLGGDLVYHCWIDGTIYTDPGLTDNQAVVVVPLSILV